jgi:DNA-directed RNA polymerase specialized sigma24 family protein
MTLRGPETPTPDTGNVRRTATAATPDDADSDAPAADVLALARRLAALTPDQREALAALLGPASGRS